MVAALIGDLVWEAFVVEGADGHEFGEFSEAAEVVDMEMGDDDVIDAREAGLGGGVVDAGGVATAGVAGVDEDGFAGRGDEERGAAAFGVDPVDAENGGGFFDGQEGEGGGCGEGGEEGEAGGHNGGEFMERGMRLSRQSELV